MKTTTIALTAWLVATVTVVNAQGPFRLPLVNPNHPVTYETVPGSGPSAPDVDPVGTVRTVILPPQSRITLENGVPKVLVSLVLDTGTWLVSGGATIQFNTNNDCSADTCPGSKFYALGAFSKTQPLLPLKADTGLESNGHDDWWAPADPKPHVVWITGATDVVYFMVEGYGQVPAFLMEAFGTMSVYKTSLTH